MVDRLIGTARNTADLALQAWPQYVRPLALELVSHRPVREVLPVDTYYVEAARVVLDPMVPREGLEWFDGRAPPAQVVLTNRHHLRHSTRYAEAFGCPIRCSEPGLHEFEGGPEVEGFAFGAELAPGVTAHQLGVICPDETALHIRTKGGNALAFADGLTRPRGGGLAFVPRFLMGDDPSTVQDELRAALRGLLDLDFDHLLFAHGEPLIGDGKAALRDFANHRSPTSARPAASRASR